MSEYIKELEKRKKELESALKSAEKFMKKAPEGRLRITSNGEGYPQYYHVTKTIGSTGKYIKKKDRHLVETLAQKEYSNVFITRVKQELAMIDAILIHNKSCPAESIQQLMHEKKQTYITPYIQDCPLNVREISESVAEMLCYNN